MSRLPSPLQACAPGWQGPGPDRAGRGVALAFARRRDKFLPRLETAEARAGARCVASEERPAEPPFAVRCVRVALALGAPCASAWRTARRRRTATSKASINKHALLLLLFPTYIFLKETLRRNGKRQAKHMDCHMNSIDDQLQTAVAINDQLKSSKGTR